MTVSCVYLCSWSHSFSAPGSFASICFSHSYSSFSAQISSAIKKTATSLATSVSSFYCPDTKQIVVVPALSFVSPMPSAQANLDSWRVMSLPTASLIILSVRWPAFTLWPFSVTLLLLNFLGLCSNIDFSCFLETFAAIGFYNSIRCQFSHPLTLSNFLVF